MFYYEKGGGGNQDAGKRDKGRHARGLSKLAWTLIGLWDRVNSVTAWCEVSWFIQMKILVQSKS